MVMLHTSRIYRPAPQKGPGTYIHNDAGNFRMKEASGADVKLSEDRKEYLVEPSRSTT